MTSDQLPAPSVRLAYNPGPVNAYKALDPPTVRLAVTTAMTSTANSSGANRYPMHSAPSDKGAVLAPALLVSYVYLAGFLKHKHRYHYRDWVLDSGAFSAHNSGTEIKLQDYIDTAKELLETDPTLTEVFALDVIGDWRASLKNCEEMWRQGVPAIPCFHYGEPWEALINMASDYPKIALGGVAMMRGDGKMKFAEQCFARTWPKKIHGFGYGSEKQIMGLPWHSVDATNWEIGPCRFGRWNTFGQMSVRGSNQNLRSEVEWYLELERKARFRWRKQMSELGRVAEPNPALRLAVGAAADNIRNNSAFALGTNDPSVRLACCMKKSEGGAWGARSMTRALGKERVSEQAEGTKKNEKK